MLKVATVQIDTYIFVDTGKSIAIGKCYKFWVLCSKW